MRTQLTKITLAAGIALATAFIFSCHDGGNDDPGTNSPSGADNSSPSGGSSSSVRTPSGGPSSSSSVEYTGGSCDINDYRTVEIGSQTWMAEDYGCYVPNSKCYGDVPDNCKKYGRLYDKATAMALPSKCNNLSSYNDEDCAIAINHRDICPSGWRIPDNTDWEVLIKFVNPNCSSVKSCPAGTKLKATSGWPEGGNGTDDYGFSALPNAVLGGRWLSSSENGGCSGVYYLRMTQYEDTDYPDTYSSLFSAGVRCIKDYSDKGNDISNYRTVQIGTQKWMAENLSYAVEGSKCLENDLGNCARYGRLYDWATAMALDASCNSSSCAAQVQPKHRGICPAGWHIPSDADWDVLVNYAGGSSTAGTKLKAREGWRMNNDVPTAGTDDFGFAALPSGSYFFGSWDSWNGFSYWWSASEKTDNSTTEMTIRCNGEDANRSETGYKGNELLSVRCLQD